MRKTKLLTCLVAVALSSGMTVNAQTPTGADFISAYKLTDCTIPFDINAEGQPFRVKWGMDAAWDWDYNVNRGVAHIGKGNFETGRVSFQPNDLVTDNGDGTYTLSARQQTKLKWRCNLMKQTGTTEVNINCDHEALFANDDLTGRDNYQGKPIEWYKLIKASVQYVQAQGLKVVSVSPFNEPDYVWQQATSEGQAMKDFLEIAKLIKADPFFDGIRVCGGNTLNCDRATPWYNYLFNYIDEGNTHQLAGSFANYANFFTKVRQDGKVATGDELHNVGEAIVGVQYGMQTGIWWGFDAKARGQFCLDSNEGVRLGYGEDRNHWTAGAVYRNDVTGEVHGFIGSSERQANNSSYRFVSTTRPVYFNGEGPTYQWTYDMPGGTGYQKGQINAELLFDVTWGEDVAPGIINGTYQIMNERSGMLLTMNGSSPIQNVARKTTGYTQQWKVYPIQNAGDCSYYAIDNANPALNSHLNLKDRNLNAGAKVICYNANHEDVEQWYLKYAGDGYYYIISRLSNKYLYCSGTTSGLELTMANAPSASTTANTLKSYRWRFMPIDAPTEKKAPAAPTSVTAKQRTASIELSWTAPADEDLASYTIIRGEGDEWNTIARGLTTTAFVDNNVTPGTPYIYKVIAVDYSGNRSQPSLPLEAKTIEERAMVMQLQFDEDLEDETANQLKASLWGTASYPKLAPQYKSGTRSFSFDGSSYMQLPYTIANHDEMSITLWTYWSSSIQAWQRIFDFGNGTDQYMFLCPGNGSEMRFVMKNKGDEQILSAGRNLAVTSWHHIAITIANDKVTMYYDGEELASSDKFTIKPSDIAPVMNYLARSQFPADPLFKGRMDDFRIYNYPLSAEEVKAVMTDVGEVAADYKDQYEETLPTAIEGVQMQGTDANAAVYDLQGRRISKPARGVYIQDGKKVLK